MDILRGLTILGNYGLKPFDNCDWDGYAGAESFNDAVEPFHAEIDYDHFGFTIVFDKNGLEFYYDAKDGKNDDLSAELPTYRYNGDFEHCLMFLKIICLNRMEKDEVEYVFKNFCDEC